MGSLGNDDPSSLGLLVHRPAFVRAFFCLSRRHSSTMFLRSLGLQGIQYRAESYCLNLGILLCALGARAVVDPMNKSAPTMLDVDRAPSEIWHYAPWTLAWTCAIETAKRHCLCSH